MIQLIKTQDKFILVSDEEIKVGDSVICGIIIGKYQRDLENNTYDILCKGNCYPFSAKSDLTKIISESPDFSLLSEEDCKKIGFVDVEKLVYGESYKNPYRTQHQEGVIKGFKTAQSLNDKMFSLEDMREAIRLAQVYNVDTQYDEYDVMHEILKHTYSQDMIIQSLQQTEWDVEVEMDTSIVKIDKNISYQPSPIFEKLQPKITNNSIKVIKILWDNNT